MFSKTYRYVLRHPVTKRGYWGNWYYKRRYDGVLDRLTRLCRRSATLLEFGCGLGFYAKYLEEAGSECRYVGCDIDDKSLRSAYRGKATDYVKCDVQQSPFDDCSADVVLCSEVLEHLNYPYKTLEDISRIATGTLVITFPQELLLSTFKDSHPEHISAISGARVVNLLVSRQFEVVDVSHIFSSFIPCGILEFMRIPRNGLTQTVVASIDKLLGKIVPAILVPHKTMLVEAERLNQTKHRIGGGYSTTSC